ncbi:MAG TPA: hypothetical protein VGI70_02625, partial [Polyangiales bacterium]
QNPCDRFHDRGGEGTDHQEHEAEPDRDIDHRVPRHDAPSVDFHPQHSAPANIPERRIGWPARRSRRTSHRSILSLSTTVCREAWSAERVMHRHRALVQGHFPRPSAQRACEVLGEAHPVARASERSVIRTQQAIVAVAFTGLGATLLEMRDRSLLIPFVPAGSMAVAVFVLAAFAARMMLGDAVLSAIAGGEEPVGVREFDGTFAMLRAAPYRARLARTFDAYADTWTTPPQRAWTPLPPGTPCAPARTEMHDVAALLRREPAPNPRAIALCVQLVTQGAGSPLFRGDSTALDAELRRIRYHAARDDAAAMSMDLTRDDRTSPAG